MLFLMYEILATGTFFYSRRLFTIKAYGYSEKGSLNGYEKYGFVFCLRYIINVSFIAQIGRQDPSPYIGWNFLQK